MMCLRRRGTWTGSLGSEEASADEKTQSAATATVAPERFIPLPTETTACPENALNCLLSRSPQLCQGSESRVLLTSPEWATQPSCP